MSLGIALNSALTGLNSIQSALQVASNNVSNASTEGFTKKSVETLPLLLAGQGAGTSLSDVSRSVNDVLIRDMRVQLTSLGALRVDEEYFTRMQDLFGSLASGTSVTANITKLANAFEALATSPEEPAIRQQVVAAAEALTRQFNDMGAEIQTMRADADKAISDAVAVINTELGQIQQLNEQIARAVAADQPTGAASRSARQVAQHPLRISRFHDVHPRHRRGRHRFEERPHAARRSSADPHPIRLPRRSTTR